MKKPLLSIIVYFHTSRMENLRQVLRFLVEREPTEGYELVLVCQDQLEHLQAPFHSVQIINLNLSSYNKPLLCNTGAVMSKSDIIVFLDSDRILPRGYFLKYSEALRSSEIITTRSILSLPRPYSDEEIEQGVFSGVEEIRSADNQPHRKNAFSGNTLIFRDDYLRLRGMDCTFQGYGFADTDMTHRALDSGFRITYVEEPELHLYHPPGFIKDNVMVGVEQLRATCAENEVRYRKKHLNVKFF